MRPRADCRRRRWTSAIRALALVFLAVVVSPSLPARADVAALAGDLGRLRLELAELRRIQPVQANDAGRLARFEVRLGRMEEELRRLTGRIEEVEFGQRRIERRLDQLVGDLDERLAALEQGAPEPQAAPADDTPPATAPIPRPAAALDAEPAQDDGSESGDGTLGTVPESALAQLPRVDPERVPEAEPRRLEPQQQYDAAMELLRAGDYAGAERGLELFLDLNPDHPLAPNAAYWLAESHYVRQNYAAAAATFARNYRTYGKAALKAPDNLLKLGMSLHGLGEDDKACLSYGELAEEFPDAPAHIQQALSRERARAECA